MAAHKVFTCDRCKHTATAFEGEIGAWRSVQIHYLGSSNYTARWDLCLDCTKDLNEFLRRADAS